MNGYGFAYRGYSSYDDGGEKKTDNWSKPSYSSDNVFRPVASSADGKKRSVFSYAPGEDIEYLVIKAETVERVYLPVAGEYRHNSHTKVEPFKDFPVNEVKRYGPSNPVRAHEQVYSPLPSDYRHNSLTKVEPSKDYQLNEEKWREPLSTVHANRPQKVSDFLTKVQNDASRPKFGPLGSTYWGQSPASAVGYNSDHHQNQKRTDNTKYNDHYQNKDTETKPAMIMTDGWSRPNRAMWVSPPNATLSEPTNDIQTAIEHLKEATRPYSTTSPPSQYREPVSKGPKAAVYAERNNDYKLPVEETGNYARTIDSKEAARRYGGRML